MIIKSKTHRHSPGLFQRLIDYIYSDKGRSQERCAWSFFHNLDAYTPEGVLAAFRENDAFRKSRQNGVALRHHILSFAPEDSQLLSPEIIQDLVAKYLELRNEKGMVFGRLHEHDGHLHVHLLISGNEYRSGKSTRKSKAEFQRIHRELEAYQREKYPELEHSLVKVPASRERQKNPRIFSPSGKAFSEAELRMKERLGRKLTKKEALQARLTAWLDRATSLAAYYNTLEAEGFQLYEYRGKTRGILSKDGVKFRFATLGITPDMIRALESERESRMRDLRNRRYSDPYGIEIPFQG